MANSLETLTFKLLIEMGQAIDTLNKIAKNTSNLANTLSTLPQRYRAITEAVLELSKVTGQTFEQILGKLQSKYHLTNEVVKAIRAERQAIEELAAAEAKRVTINENTARNSLDDEIELLRMRQMGEEAYRKQLESATSKKLLSDESKARLAIDREIELLQQRQIADRVALTQKATKQASEEKKIESIMKQQLADGLELLKARQQADMLRAKQLKYARGGMTQEQWDITQRRTPLADVDINAVYKEYSDFLAGDFVKSKGLTPQLDDVVDAMKRIKASNPKMTFGEIGESFKRAGVNADTAAKAVSKLEPAAKRAGKGFNILRSAMGFFLASLLSALTQAVTTFFSNALKAAKEYRARMAELNFAEAILSKNGMDITRQEFDDFIANIEDKSKYLSKLEVTGIVSTVADMGAEFGLTKDKVEDLADAVAFIRLQERAYGMEVSDVGSIVNAALDGRSNFFNKLGINITKTAIAEKAYQMGIAKTGALLTKEQSNDASITLLIEQTSEKWDELIASLEGTSLGEELKMQKDIKDAILELGKAIEPVKMAFIDLFNSLNRDGELIDNLVLGFELLGSVIITITKLIEFSMKNIKWVRNAFLEVITLGKWDAEEWKKSLEEVPETVRKGQILIKFYKDLAAAQKDLGRELTQQEKSELWNNAVGVFSEMPKTDTETGFSETSKQDEALEESRKKLEDALKDLNEEIIESQMKLEQDMEDAAIDLGRKLVDIDTEYARKRAGIQKDLQDEIADINREHSRKVADINADYNTKVQDIQIEAQQEEAETSAKAKNDALQKEAEFQNEMLKLKEDYLMDLEDALHERDARQVLKLMKEYSLNKEQATRDHELEMSKAAQDEAVAKKQRQQEVARKIAEAQQDRARAIADAEIDRRRKIEDAHRDFEEKMAQLKIDQEREEVDAREHNRRINEDLIKARDDRLKIIEDRLKREYNLTEAWLKRLLNLYQMYGTITAQQMASMTGAFGTTTKNAPSTYAAKGTSGKQGGASTDAYAMAEGGTIVADRPTSVMFGEAGLEAASFVPMSRKGADVGKIFSNLSGQGGGGNIAIEVMLSPDLEARIVTNTLNETASVIARVQGSKVR